MKLYNKLCVFMLDHLWNCYQTVLWPQQGSIWLTTNKKEWSEQWDIKDDSFLTAFIEQWLMNDINEESIISSIFKRANQVSWDEIQTSH